MPFGFLLKRFRLERGLSQRKLGEAASIDHGYIDRLESRVKESPSEEVVEKLVRGLELAGRDAWLLGFVGKYREYLDIGMIEYVLEHPKITEEEVSWAVAIKFRSEKLDYQTMFECAERVRDLVEWYSKNQAKLRA